MSKPEPKRLVIKKMIEAGGCTKDSIKTDLGITAASLATNFTYLRLMGFYPVADDDGVLSFTNEAGWEEIQATKAAASKTRKSTSTKTPQERYEMLSKRVTKCKATYEKASDKAADNSSDTLLGLREEKADIELQIANYELKSLLEVHEDDINTEVPSSDADDELA